MISGGIYPLILEIPKKNLHNQTKKTLMVLSHSADLGLLRWCKTNTINTTCNNNYYGNFWIKKLYGSFFNIRYG